MADVIDVANDKRDYDAGAAVAQIRESAASMPAGAPGECDLCGEWSGRLVCGACAPCRDKWRLP